MKRFRRLFEPERGSQTAQRPSLLCGGGRTFGLRGATRLPVLVKPRDDGGLPWIR